MNPLYFLICNINKEPTLLSNIKKYNEESIKEIGKGRDIFNFLQTKILECFVSKHQFPEPEKKKKKKFFLKKKSFLSTSGKTHTFS